MGMVHALQKGELSPSDVSDKVKDVADRMDDNDAEDYASTKHSGKPEKVAKEALRKLRETIRQMVKENPSFIENFKLKKEVAKRDYKAEYKKFQSSDKAKKYRAELNQYNRKKGTYGNGDGKDASHKGGKIVGFESQSKNRGRAEKSRLKKENLGKRCTVKEVSKWLKTLEEFRYRKVRGVDARRVASFVNNGMNEEELPTSLQKKWEHKKYGREKHLATKYVETVLNATLKESVNEIFPKGAGRKISKAMQKGNYTPEKRRKLKNGEVEVMKGKGSRQKWFYLKSQNDVKQLIRLGRNHAFPTGITKNNSRLKFDKGLHIKESVNEGKFNPNKIRIHTNKAIGYLKQAQKFAKEGQKGAVWQRIGDARDELKMTDKFLESVNETKDHEGKMAKSQLERSMKYSKMIYNMIQNVDNDKDGGVQFPAWVQSKLTKAEDYLQSVFNYLDGKDGLEDKFQESVNETIEPQGNIKKVLDVAKNKQAKKIGGTLVDGTTANMMTQVWNKVNDKSKEKMNKMNAKQLTNLILKLWDRVGTPRV